MKGEQGNGDEKSGMVSHGCGQKKGYLGWFSKFNKVNGNMREKKIVGVLINGRCICCLSKEREK